jgi:hypothetical protein
MALIDKAQGGGDWGGWFATSQQDAGMLRTELIEVTMQRQSRGALESP